MRQSFWAAIYVFILLPRMKDGAEVLKQRDIQEGKELEEIKHDIDDIEEQLKQPAVRSTIIDKIEMKLGKVLDEIQKKQIDILLRMNTLQLEARDRDLFMRSGLTQKAYTDKCAMLISEETESVSIEDIDVLMLRMVRFYRTMSGDQVQELNEKLAEKKKREKVIERKFQKKNKMMKKADRDQIAKQQWPMINIMQRYLVTYSLFDFTVQLFFQMPLV